MQAVEKEECKKQKNHSESEEKWLAKNEERVEGGAGGQAGQGGRGTREEVAGIVNPSFT